MCIGICLAFGTCQARPVARSGSACIGRKVYLVRPSDADRRVRTFDAWNYVTFDCKCTTRRSKLVVFLPGTDGVPSNATDLLAVAVDQGYRVIGLEYNDFPSVAQACFGDPSPKCFGRVRYERSFAGREDLDSSDSRAQSIDRRLISALQFLRKRYPRDGWGEYLDADRPRWNEIVLSGVSQGAGMAAYIAKYRRVGRVVLFSGPWDFVESSQQLASWLSQPSATPAGRWFGEYHAREVTASLLRKAYKALGIPKAHILVFNANRPADDAFGDNPFHVGVIHDTVYTRDWGILFGSASFTSCSH